MGALKLAPQPKYSPFGPFDCESEVIAVSGWTPNQVVTSYEIETELKKIDPSFNLNIEEITGVRERRVAPAGMSILDMAVKATEKVFKNSGISPAMIDLVIFSSVSREYLEPAMATLVCRELGIKNAKAFDITNACLGFVDAWMTADAQIQAGRSRLALIVGSEISNHHWRLALDIYQKNQRIQKELLPSFTLGDGAAAMLVGTRHKREGCIRTISGIRESYGEYSDLCIIRDYQTPMVTDARGLFTAALKHSPKLVKDLLTHLQWNPGDIDLVIPHQASIKVMEQASRLMKIPVDKAHITLNRFGNMASVSVPFTLAEAIDQGRLTENQRVLILGYGSGLGVGLLALTMNKK